MASTLMQAVKTSASSVAAGANVFFEDILSSEGAISYDNSTGTFIVGEAGSYVYMWSASSQSLVSKGGASFTVIMDSIHIEGSSPVKQGETTSFGILVVSNLPAAISLINSADQTVFFPPDTPVQVNFILQRLADDPITTTPYMDLPLTAQQTLAENDFLAFSTPQLQNGIQYDSSLRLVAILDPGIYQLTLFFFGDATTVRMNSISYAGDRDFVFPSGYGYKTITFLEQFPEPNYIGFSNPTSSTFQFGLTGTGQDGGLVITKIAAI